ncbi:hypothetical protein IAD21_00750 [Abditibacteriota bacterium]|nr:hypothetical protein IAD21_00750 [Abditibacteriota bacterium]
MSNGTINQWGSQSGTIAMDSSEAVSTVFFGLGDVSDAALRHLLTSGGGVGTRVTAQYVVLTSSLGRATDVTSGGTAFNFAVASRNLGGDALEAPRGEVTAPEAPPPSGTFLGSGRDAITHPAVAIATIQPEAFTLNGRVMSIILNDALVGMSPQAEKEMPTSQVSSWSIPVSISAEDKPYFHGYLVDVRGFVHKTADARATLALNIGGALHTVDFGYGQELNGDFYRSFYCPQVENAPDNSYPIQEVLSAILLIQVEGFKDAEAVLVVDSLDIGANGDKAPQFEEETQETVQV